MSFAKPIGYYVVEGKVSSSGGQLTPEQDIICRSSAESCQAVDGPFDDGTYGVCESCGQPIGKMRVMAFPRATLCLSCKQREERR